MHEILWGQLSVSRVKNWKVLWELHAHIHTYAHFIFPKHIRVFCEGYLGFSGLSQSPWGFTKLFKDPSGFYRFAKPPGASRGITKSPRTLRGFMRLWGLCTHVYTHICTILFLPIAGCFAKPPGPYIALWALNGFTKHPGPLRGLINTYIVFFLTDMCWCFSNS